jgi:hypothetical protein
MHGLDFDAREQQHNAGEKGNGAKAMDCGPIARMARTTLDGNRCAQNFGLLGMQGRVRQLHEGSRSTVRLATDFESTSGCPLEP